MSNRVLGDLLQKMGLQGGLNWLRKKVNYTRTVRIKGAEVRIPSIHGMSCDPTEPWMVELLDKVLQKRSGLFLDVGVNVGQTLVKVKALDPEREYVGFEPNPACVFYTQNLINVNAFKNCTLVPVGLFTKDCVLSLDFYSEFPEDSSACMIDNFRPGNRIYSRAFVPVFQFQSLAAILGEKSVGVVKIDVEGAELEVVKSLLGLIKRDKPIVLIELLPVYSVDNTFRQDRQEELEGLFADIGCSIFLVKKTPFNDYAGLVRSEEIGIHSDLTRCDYVILPVDQLTQLQLTTDLPAQKSFIPTGAEASWDRQAGVRAVTEPQ
jgi:FkbM family methyltransferase